MDMDYIAFSQVHRVYIYVTQLHLLRANGVVGLFTGHLFKLGPTCEQCLEKEEDCEAMAYLRFRHLGQFFVWNQVTTTTPPINEVLYFIRSVGLIKR
jgi:hypothetical protein